METPYEDPDQELKVSDYVDDENERENLFRKNGGMRHKFYLRTNPPQRRAAVVYDMNIRLNSMTYQDLSAQFTSKYERLYKILEDSGKTTTPHLNRRIYNTNIKDAFVKSKPMQ